VNATDAFYEKLDEEIEVMAEFKKLCARNTELAHQNLSFRCCIRNTSKLLRAMRRKPLEEMADRMDAVLSLNAEGV
jgi:hypothetical protein